MHVAATNAADGQHPPLPAPATWQLEPAAAYVHLCSNETIHGVEFQSCPTWALGCDAPLVIDCSSHMASRPVDWSRVGLAFGGAQKNIGPAGLTMVVVREDLLGHALPICPCAFNYKTVADNDSMYNTPPTYAIYMAGLVFQWLQAPDAKAALTGMAAMEQRNIAKAAPVRLHRRLRLLREQGRRPCRSRMNVPFFLRRAATTLPGRRQGPGLLQLKGHKWLAACAPASTTPCRWPACRRWWTT